MTPASKAGLDSSSSASSLSKGESSSAVDGGLPDGVKEATDLVERQMSGLSLGNNQDSDEVFAPSADNMVRKQNIENLARAGSEEGRTAVQDIIEELQSIKSQTR